MQWSRTNIYDNKTEAVAANGVDLEYCGPQTITATQIKYDSDGLPKAEVPFHKGIVSNPSYGNVVLDMDVATHQDYGKLTVNIYIGL